MNLPYDFLTMLPSRVYPQPLWMLAVDPFPTLTFPFAMSYCLDRDELLRIRERKLLTSDRDYLFFALQIDYPDKPAPTLDVVAFCERWGMSDGNLYKALGELHNKGIVVSIANRLDLKFGIAPPEDNQQKTSHKHLRMARKT